MTTELAKTYDPASVEAEAYAVWMGEKCFHADPNAPGEPYSIVIPPPNVTGALHLGHAINNTLQDILTRMHRMAGYNTVWIPGIDHAGIATQAVVEKQLKEKENKTRHDVGREGLVARIWEWKEQYGNRILMQLQRLGCSCDWDRTRFTLDEMCARAVRETFFKLFKDGLIFRGKRLVNWDVYLQTSVSDDEIYYEAIKTSLWHIRYPIEGTDKSMVVATTRPETMLGDTAVAVHPDDPRWNWAIGKKVRLPLVDRLIPIIADPILVDPKFGTGVVKVTPAHDPNDYAVWQRHKGLPDEIDILNIITPDGKINENGGKYAGLKREAARKQVVSDLEHQGLLVKEEPYETQVGHSDRSKTPIEPYLSDQWFVKMAPLAEPALEVVREGIVKFYPERHAQQYLSWLGEKRDWPISRQLWWGHRIPVWTLQDQTVIQQFASEYQRHALPITPDFIDLITWAFGPKHAIWSELLAAGLPTGKEQRTEINRQFSIQIGREANVVTSVQVCFGPGMPVQLVSVLEKYGFVQDPDVLDTWFSSALWPHSTLGWPDNTPELKKWYPTSVLVTARDIITLWVARMVMMGLYNMGHNQFTAETESEAKEKIRNTQYAIRSAVPFHAVAINPTILDGKGERMSKSKGNGVDPVDIIETHGADALRFTLTQMATETQDARLPVKKLPNGKNTSDKFDVGRNFCNKIWNATRFALQNLASIPAEPVDEAKWSIVDRWILSRLMRTVKECDEAIANYRFDQYARTCYDFFWRDLCDWYVEAIKPEMKEGPQGGRRGQVANVLAACLDVSMRLMHPMIPFITETIWWKLNEVRPERTIPNRITLRTNKRLIASEWPKFNDDITSEGAEFVFAKLQELIAGIRNVRNEYKVDPKKPVTVSIAAPGDASRQILANKGVIELLATCTIHDVKADLPAPKDAARTTAAGCEVFVEGLVDQDAEKQRIAKRREELTKQISALKGRLANKSYAEKAPAHLVQQTKDQLAEAEAELAKLG